MYSVNIVCIVISRKTEKFESVLASEFCNIIITLERHRFTGQGLSSGWAPLRNGLGQATYTCVPVTKQYNLVPAKGVISSTGKVTAGLVESNSSLPPGL